MLVNDTPLSIQLATQNNTSCPFMFTSSKYSQLRLSVLRQNQNSFLGFHICSCSIDVWTLIGRILCIINLWLGIKCDNYENCNILYLDPSQMCLNFEGLSKYWEYQSILSYFNTFLKPCKLCYHTEPRKIKKYRRMHIYSMTFFDLKLRKSWLLTNITFSYLLI